MKEKIFNDINELINESYEMFKKIDEKELISKVKVKNILENLRSSLEYSAQYISGLLQNPQKKVYFPYAKTEKDFEDQVNKNLPNLKNEYPNIFDLIKSLQLFISKNDWLIKLSKATNIAKHNQALNVSQNIHSEKTVSNISAEGFNIIASNIKTIKFSGNIFNGQKIDDFDINDGIVTNFVKNEVTVNFNFEIKENQIIIIEDIEENLFEFIEKCTVEIKLYIANLKNI